MDKETFDQETVYCPMLGHSVPFAYCRQAGDGLLCTRIRGCWSGRIDISTFLERCYAIGPDQQIGSHKGDKMVSIYELMLQAQERNKAGEKDKDHS